MISNRFPLACLLTLLAGFTTAVVAAPAAARHAAVTLKQADAIIAHVSAGRVHAKRLFDGPDGLVGVITQGSHGHQDVVWLTPNGRAIIHGGEVLAPDGTDLMQQAKYDQGLLLRPAATLKAVAAKPARGIMVGRSGPVMTVLIDPNCVYCHVLYKQLKPEVEAGRLRVRYVMVGTLKASSLDRASAILAADSPADALARDELKFDRRSEEGGYASRGHTAAMDAVVKANTELFDKAGATGTPALLYCSKASGKVEMVVGLPTKIPDVVADMSTRPNPACG